MVDKKLWDGVKRADDWQPEIMQEPFEDGFNIKTILGALFVGFIMLPGTIYLGLVTGTTLGGAAQWVTILLFMEIAKRSFIKFKRQELIILFWVAGGLLTLGGKLGTSAVFFGGPFGGFIWDQYLVQSPQAANYGITELIPRWVVPQPDSPALINRTFFHKDWLLPIVVLVITMILGRINALSLGYIVFRITNDLEKLPFPLAPVGAAGATALADASSKKETWRWRTFSTGAMLGLLFGAFYVGIPALTGIFLTEPLQFLPIPFIDLTTDFSEFLPATPIGLMTDIGLIFSGFIIPFPVLLGSFLASTLVTFFVNPTLYRVGILHTWQEGMGLLPTNMANAWDFFISFNIGTAIIVALIGIYNIVKTLKKQSGVNKWKMAPPPEGRSDMSITKAFLIWLVSTLGYIILCKILVPSFPIWITAIFGLLWTPIFSYISAKMAGLTGGFGTPQFPMVREGCFVLSGYQGAAIWFAPIPMMDHGGQATTFKQLELTRTKFVSYVKMTIAVFFIMIICSFIFWSLIWKIAPIPSAAYPFVQRMWPINAEMQCLWISSTLEDSAGGMLKAIRLPHILCGVGAAGLLYAFILFAKFPILFFYGAVGGLGAGFFVVFPSFIGALLRRYYFEKKFGVEKWFSIAPILMAGYSCGFGLTGMISCAIALISKSVSELVY